MSQKIINHDGAEGADVLFISAPYELTASFHKGTAAGPAKVVECLNTQIEFWDRRYKAEGTDSIRIAHTEIAGLESMTPENAHEAIVSTCTNGAAMNFLLGGEHSVTFGALKALSKKHDPKDVTIVQIDAHCDLRADDSDYTDSDPSI